MAAVRGHHEGSLFRRSRDGKWVAAVTMPNGRRRSRSAASKGKGVENLRELLRQRDQAVADPGRLTVGKYLSEWIADVTGLAPSTVRQHEHIIRNHLEPAFRHVRLAALSPSDVDAYLDRSPLDPQTKRHHRATLRRALADGLRDGLIVRNAAALSRAPRLDKPERTILTAEQMRIILDASRDERYWPLWTLLAHTGMRVSEALGLVWSDIDGDTIRLRSQLARVDGAWVRAPLKTRKSRRDVPLTAEVVEALRVQGERQDAEREAAGVPQPIDGYVFTTVTGKPVHLTNILPDWYRVLARLGMPRVTTHDIRHSTATILYAAGVPLEAIADLLGHSTTRVTADLYRHRVPEVQRAAVDRFAEALRG